MTTAAPHLAQDRTRRSVPATLLVGLITGVVIALTSLLHEVGHWGTGLLLGVPGQIYWVNSTGVFGKITPLQNGLITGAGPLVTIVIGVIGFIVCVRHRRSTSSVLTVVRGVTAATLPQLALQMTTVAGRSPGSTPPDFAGIVAILDAPNPLRVVILLVGFVLLLGGAVLFGHWALRADRPAERRLSTWRTVLAAVLLLGQTALVIANAVTLSSPNPGSWGILSLFGTLLTLPVVGALLVPWRDAGARPLIRRDVVPIAIAWVVQLAVSLADSTVNYGLTMLPLLGYTFIGAAVVARHARGAGGSTSVVG